LIGPVSAGDVGWLAAEGDDLDGEIAALRSFGFMTSMHCLRDWLNGLPGPETLLAGKWRLSAMLRRGLGIMRG
jgi:hypothetical protein